MSKVTQHSEQESVRHGFEIRDASALGITLAGLGLLLGVLAVMGGVWGLYHWLGKESPVRPLYTGEWSYSEGHLQLIMQEHKAMRRDYEQHLTRYGWVDAEQGVARIPIEDAMHIVAREGLPQWGEPSQRTLIEEIYQNASER